MSNAQPNNESVKANAIPKKQKPKTVDQNILIERQVYKGKSGTSISHSISTDVGGLRLTERITEDKYELIHLQLKRNEDKGRLMFTAPVEYLTGIDKNGNSYYIINFPIYSRHQNDDTVKNVYQRMFINPDRLEILRKKGLLEKINWQTKSSDEIKNIVNEMEEETVL